jgi:hypothetical protein
MAQAFIGIPNVRVVAPAAHPDQFTLSIVGGADPTAFYATTPSNSCSARIYLDGVEQLNYDDFRAMQPADVAAVEIFNNVKTTPAQFVNDSFHFGDRGVLLGRQACGTVVVWTKWAFS